MSFETDEKLDLKGARTVRLAGREFYVAPMSLRQILATADLVPKLAGGFTAENLSAERLTPFVDVTWRGLLRAHPNLTREEFLDLPISVSELIAALPVVLDQMGAEKSGGDPGEPRAASNSASSTGARSSPN